MKKKLELKYAENSFTVYFSGLHFTAPLRNKYKYMLEGFDTAWISSGSGARFAKYTNLRPRKYRLKIMVSNSDGFWNETPKIITITVIAPWLFSDLALVIYVLFVLLMLWFFRRFTINIYRREIPKQDS